MQIYPPFFYFAHALDEIEKYSKVPKQKRERDKLIVSSTARGAAKNVIKIDVLLTKPVIIVRYNFDNWLWVDTYVEGTITALSLSLSASIYMYVSAWSSGSIVLWLCLWLLPESNRGSAEARPKQAGPA